MLYSRHYKGLNVYIAGVNLVKLSEVPPSLRALSHSLSQKSLCISPSLLLGIGSSLSHVFTTMFTMCDRRCGTVCNRRR